MRKFEIIRTEWPALFKFDGKYFEEEFNIDVNKQRFTEVSDEYVAAAVVRTGRVEWPQTPANPGD